MPQNTVSQNFVFLYCHYDSQHGNRDWKSLLSRNEVQKIDLKIAQRALAAGELETTVIEMLYWGSPFSQQINDFCERTDYAASIVERANTLYINN